MEAQAEAVHAAPVAVVEPKTNWWTEMSTGNKLCCVFLGLFAVCCWAMNAGPDPRDPRYAGSANQEAKR
jgi:hypothetical protein